jgi:hypothetical protein
VTAPPQAGKRNDATSAAAAYSGPYARSLREQEPEVPEAPTPDEYESPRAT